MAKKEIVKREGIKTEAELCDILRSEGLLLALCFGHQGMAKIVEHEIAELKKGFDYENSSGVEQALIDHIVLCWMRLKRWEFSRANFDAAGTHSRADIEFVEKHLHMAHTRYLRSIEELVKVRFLMSRTNMHRLQIVREGMKKKEQPGEPGKVLELKAG